MVSCVFPGSFDPVTKGHMDLIERAAGLFDHVTVTIMNNIRKTGAIPVRKRADMLRKACAQFPNVRVEVWDGLLAEYMKQNHERIVIRGIRSAAEMDQEMQACAANRKLNPEIETVFLAVNPAMNGISSSAVREIAAFGGDILSFVPPEAAEEIAQLLANK